MIARRRPGAKVRRALAGCILAALAMFAVLAFAGPAMAQVPTVTVPTPDPDPDPAPDPPPVEPPPVTPPPTTSDQPFTGGADTTKPPPKPVQKIVKKKKVAPAKQARPAPVWLKRHEVQMPRAYEASIPVESTVPLGGIEPVAGGSSPSTSGVVWAVLVSLLAAAVVLLGIAAIPDWVVVRSVRTYTVLVGWRVQIAATGLSALVGAAFIFLIGTSRL